MKGLPRSQCSIDRHLAQTLCALRRRRFAQSLIEECLAAALIAGAVLVAAGFVNRWLFHRMPWNGGFALAVASAAVTVALVRAFMRRMSLPGLAARLDALGGTRDRLVSALAFSKESAN